MIKKWTPELFANPNIDPEEYPEWQNLHNIVYRGGGSYYIKSFHHPIIGCTYVPDGNTIRNIYGDKILIPKAYLLRQALIWRWQLSLPCYNCTISINYPNLYSESGTRDLISKLTGENPKDIDLSVVLHSDEFLEDEEDLVFAERQCEHYRHILQQTGMEMVTGPNTSIVEGRDSPLKTTVGRDYLQIINDTN